MELSIKNYKNVLPKDLIKRAGKCSVRECDEVKKGQFQAYVDENDTSFDVAISFDDKEELIQHQCDCESKAAFCQHKIALLQFIVNKEKETRLPGNAKKLDRLDMLVNEVDVKKLREWLKELLIKNKDLELAFVHQFSNRQKEHTSQDVKRLTLDAVKAVIKNKRKIEVGEVKKIVDLWTEMHHSFVDQYCSDLTDEESFRRFNALVEACEETQLKVSTSSNRFNKYLEGLLSKVIAALNELQNEDAWNTATGYFADLVNGETLNLRLHYLSFLTKALETRDGEVLIDKLVTGYVKSDLTKFYHGNVYTEALFNIVLNSASFEKYYHVFKPIAFNNDYNELLIEALINAGYLQLAEKYCLEQIKRNFKEEYNILYLQFLKDIYTIEKDEHKLSGVLKELFPVTFNFDDYLFIYARMENEEEQKKWRSKVLARARQLVSNQNAMKFSFKLMELEQKYGKMIEYINEYTSYNIIAEYAERMILTDKKDFLKTIFHKVDRSYDMDEEDVMKSIPVLLGLLKKYYTESEIKWGIDNASQSGWSYSPNVLIAFIKSTDEITRR